MDWNSLFEQWGATWGAYGALILVAFKSFVLDPITSRKTQFNLASFKTLQTSVKDEIKAYTKIMADSFEDVKKQVVQPLIEKIEQKEYQQALANDIIVSLLANVNVPLVNKLDTFKSLSKLEGMNQELITKLQSSIENQVATKNVETKRVEQVYENLKGV